MSKKKRNKENIEGNGKRLTNQADPGEINEVVDKPQDTDGNKQRFDPDLLVAPHGNNQNSIARHLDQRRKASPGEDLDHDKADVEEHRDPDPRKQLVFTLERARQNHRSRKQAAKSAGISFQDEIVDRPESIDDHVADHNGLAAYVAQRVRQQNRRCAKPDCLSQNIHC